jgi:murein DD-endopeptidase MepM/ murein hydrolase activator NlpD
MLVQAHTTQEGALLGIRFTAGRESVLGFERDGDEFRAIDEMADVVTRQVFKSGEVRSSLFAAADYAGLPDSVTMQLADIFSGDVDFHRDLKRGDRFSVVYEVLYHDGRPLRTGRVLAAEFVNDRKVHRAFWFDDEEGKTGYYSADGKNLRKAFLRSPLEFSRVTSGFGTREHPIAHETRAHKGVDYSAPTGTKVRAAADGTVDFAGFQNGYGNVIILRHRSGITTLYAHLSGFDVVQGARVSQGELIGYVGSTGWATGPHLHYEFRVNNEYRNPLTLAMPAAEPVAPHRAAAFRATTEMLTEQLGLLATTRLAALD